MAKIDKEKLKNVAGNVAGKGKGFLAEFKEFVLRGNVMDMAVGVIIGSAFATIVTALTNDFINPLINSIGGTEIGGSIHLPWTPVGEAGQYLLWGDFVTSVINFLIMAFILFLMLKFVNGLVALTKKKKAEETESEVVIKSDETILLEQILAELKKKK